MYTFVYRSLTTWKRSQGVESRNETCLWVLKLFKLWSFCFVCTSQWAQDLTDSLWEERLLVFDVSWGTQSPAWSMPWIWRWVGQEGLISTLQKHTYCNVRCACIWAWARVLFWVETAERHLPLFGPQILRQDSFVDSRQAAYSSDRDSHWNHTELLPCNRNLPGPGQWGWCSR